MKMKTTLPRVNQIQIELLSKLKMVLFICLRRLLKRVLKKFYMFLLLFFHLVQKFIDLVLQIFNKVKNLRNLELIIDLHFI